MYQCVILNKKNLGEFKCLNKSRGVFNPLNEDFFKIYDSCNFAQQMLLRRKVKLLKNSSKYLGYIWVSINENNICTINALNVLFGEKNKITRSAYETLIDTIKSGCIIDYLCENNEYNSFILNSLGFSVKEGTFVLFKDLKENIPLTMLDDLKFNVLKRGKDEAQRCYIQNEIFKDESRIPLTSEDIFFDEMQNYYLDRGAVFVEKDGKNIGYGQVILEDYVPLIVNFGILKEHRGKGYSKSLLSYLLKTIQCSGFNKVKIKVKMNNIPALNLYKSFGFKVEYERYKWQLHK